MCTGKTRFGLAPIFFCVLPCLVLSASRKKTENLINSLKSLKMVFFITIYPLKTERGEEKEDDEKSVEEKW